MLIRVLSQTPLSSNDKNSFFNRKFIVLFTLGGASVTAFWIYRRNIYKFMQNRRKEGNSVVSSPHFFLPIFYPMFVWNDQIFLFLSPNLPFHILPKNNQKDFFFLL
ncbi:unnamed protein product [Meloidogyne enterolobii]|uniref:Uncharacterized protein n=1 Tax=Meloidogyne enterolobii TaxID=390850 RepID=A0ACB1AWR0_MELEN